jgi:hypothetical protein
MRRHWPESKKVLDLLAYIVKRWDSNGIDLRFTISKDTYNESTATSIVADVGAHLPSSTTSTIADIHNRVDAILRKYRINAEKKRGKRWSLSEAKKTNFFIFIDGKWQPELSPESSIRELVKALKDCDLPKSQFGIQFIQFGAESGGTAPLSYFDNLPGLDQYGVILSAPCALN